MDGVIVMQRHGTHSGEAKLPRYLPGMSIAGDQFHVKTVAALTVHTSRHFLSNGSQSAVCSLSMPQNGLLYSVLLPLHNWTPKQSEGLN